jgi:purine-nucleoside phosphorylase
MPYADLPDWPVSTVPGHEGSLVSGAVRGRPVVVLAGRSHLYEGLNPRAVTFGIRVLGLIGVRVLILTNAAGAVNPRVGVGTLMVIDDHINLMGDSPLAGPSDNRFGPRFPDMTEVYSARLRDLADRAGQAIGRPLAHGIYAAVRGPSYETPAEIRYLRLIGVDAVGMSTVPEALVARQMGIEVLGLSCVTNLAAGVRPGLLTHAEVLARAAQMRQPIAALLEDVIGRL